MEINTNLKTEISERINIQYQPAVIPDLPAHAEICPDHKPGKKIDASTTPFYESTILQNEDALHQLADEWEALAVSADATVYMIPDWIQGWWKNFGKQDQRSLHILTIRYNGKLVAIAPFYSGYSAFLGKIVEKRLQLLGSGGSPNEQLGFADDYGISDFLDFIVSPEHEMQVAKIFSDFLIAAADDFDTILFHQIRDDSFIMKFLYPLLQETQLDLRVEQTDNCPFIHLDSVQTIDGFIATTKSNARRRLRQTKKAMNPGGDFEIRQVTQSPELEKAIQKLIDMHQERWIELGYPGIFHDERFTKFFNEMILSFHKKNRIWFKEAVDKKGTSAMRLMMRYNNRYYDYISGFDKNAISAKARPGFGILLNSIEEALIEGYTAIELLRGEENYKFDFTDQSVKNWKVIVHRRQNISAARKFLHVMAFWFRVFSREKKVLRARSKKNGRLRMLPGYLQFRFQSILRKLKS